MSEAKRAPITKDAPICVRIEKELKVLYKIAGRYNMEAKLKATRLEQKTQRITSQVDAYLADSKSEYSEEAPSDPEAPPSRAQLYFYKGRALDADATYSAEAEDWLSRAVKLEPTLIEGWNCLANCYWKKKNLNSAHSCLLSAVEQKRMPSTLRMLSMVVKNMIPEGKLTPDQKVQAKKDNVTQSVAYAREAIALDLQDSESWYVLGNALLADFFTNTRNRETLTNALKAYKRAEASQSNNPDLYFNRGNILRYFEDYQDAVTSYRRAAELDPSLPTENIIDTTTRFVRKTTKTVATKMGKKPRQIVEIMQELPATVQWLNLEVYMSV
jgi:tetratricopeptide (TPR) repeat protein